MNTKLQRCKLNIQLTTPLVPAEPLERSILLNLFIFTVHFVQSKLFPPQLRN